MTTIEEFQNFIKENNVLTPKDFKERFGDIYNEMKNLKLHQEVKYPTQPGLTKLVNTLGEFQQFIDENDIEHEFLGNIIEKLIDLYQKLITERIIITPGHHLFDLSLTQIRFTKDYCVVPIDN